MDVKEMILRGLAMGDVETRYALNVLLDFYGPLLTEHRREVVRLYCEEDLSLQEIADQLGITRQAASDAVIRARRQLANYEAQLHLAARHRAQTAAARRCLAALDRVSPAPGSEAALKEARWALAAALDE